MNCVGNSINNKLLIQTKNVGHLVEVLHSINGNLAYENCVVINSIKEYIKAGRWRSKNNCKVMTMVGGAEG